ESIEMVIKLLNPFAPHVSEELWEKLGHQSMLLIEPFPELDPKALVKDTLNIVVQVNGKLRGEIEVGVALPKEDIIKAAAAEDKVKSHLDGKELVKTIFVPGKLINFVVK
ncbi:MAG: class I tRNA ligase family protein, partial [Bdellovibrionales bacterium]|nr:class I tRNA ligase family protein [Bdellovibrionales bacterium]